MASGESKMDSGADIDEAKKSILDNAAESAFEVVEEAKEMNLTEAKH